MQKTKMFQFETNRAATSPAHSPLRHPRVLLATAVFLGWAADRLFVGKPLGISLLLFVLLLVGALFDLGLLEKKRPCWTNLWLLAPLFFFATMAFVRANATLTTLNTLAVIALLAYLAFYYGGGWLSELSLPGMGLVPLRTGLHSVTQTPSLLQDSMDTRTLRRHARRHFLPILRGLLLAMPVLLVFTGLLAAADLVFAGYLEQVTQLAFLQRLATWTGHGVVTLSLSWLLAGGLVFALAVRTEAEADKNGLEEWIDAIPRRVALGFTEAGTVLVLVNALFGAFVLVQFAYLFGGARHLEQQGFSYAEYARRGFFELVAVAVLTLMLVIFFNWCTRRENKRQIRLFNGLSTVLMGLVLVLLVSAWVRMSLYEAAFGYTELRLLVFVFMIWLGAALLWFVVTLWKRPSRFAVGLVACATGFLVTLNLVNPDVFIVRHNVARYVEMGDLDAAYLVTLSHDAVPELLQALPLVANDPQRVPAPACYRAGRLRAGSQTRAGCTATPGEIFTENLALRYEAMQESSEWRQWPSTHLARQRAWRLLSEWQE